MNTTLETAPLRGETTISELVQSVCQRIPPLWPLKNFVAVNPFAGLTGRHFIETVELMRRVGHGEMLMPAEFYREQLAAGRIREPDVRKAVGRAKQTLPAAGAGDKEITGSATLAEALAEVPSTPPVSRVLTVADFLDAHSESAWAALVVEEISKWCSAYYDQGQSSWRMPWRHLGLWAAWKQAAQRDANPELAGLPRFRARVAALPDDPLVLIGSALERLEVPEAWQADFLHRQLMGLPGWSGYVQFNVRENGLAGRADDSLVQLLAIRLVYDIALADQFGTAEQWGTAWKNYWRNLAPAGPLAGSDLRARYVAQLALESAYQDELMEKLKFGKPASVRSAPKTLQAVFCIDVRSEVFRRSLEAQSDGIQTIGFAGFFGMPIAYRSLGQTGCGAHCPVLLSPKIIIREGLQPASASGEQALRDRLAFRQNLSRAWNSFRTSAISCFAFVETAGLGYGLRLVRDSLGWGAPEFAFARPSGGRRLGPNIEREPAGANGSGPETETGMAFADQLALAAGALKNMGLVADFAPVVLICGHGSATTNNPYGSALDCGACGGHAGDVNARVAAAILNQPKVRAGLQAQGIEIPAGTVFLAALHNTTTDEILIYDADQFPAGRAGELATITHWLAAASRQARRERAAALGLAGIPPDRLDEAIFARSRDWSQVRPEWGLANNAAFIAAPRERTRGLNLGGRTFLHDYYADRDADKSTLELIMVAPMVVASWINLQYYASTVDNRLFGSGNKVLHNVVGTLGVWQGNGGDLQTGLPLQSLQDGSRRMHEPLRLNVVLAADPAEIERILARQPGVRELVTNGWVNLFALEPAGPRRWRYVGHTFVEET